MAATLYETIRDTIVDRLGDMRRAEGYLLDYGDVLLGARSYGVHDSDFGMPKVGLRWVGEVPQDPISGGEMAAATTKRLALFEITVPVRDNVKGDHEARAWKVMADVHKAMLQTIAVRAHGLGNAAMWEGVPEWVDTSEGGEGTGGTLVLPFLIRFHHTTGDLTTER